MDWAVAGCTGVKKLNARISTTVQVVNCILFLSLEVFLGISIY
jgi:hypothetical protein